MLYHREVKEYLHAKREAARRQGTHHLPSNAEVHAQLLVIAERVDGDKHLRRLTEMRERALSLMELLAPFNPRLIGSVLTGHIRRGSDIDLHVYTEEVDDVCRVLDEAGHAHVVEVVTTRKYGDPREFTHVRLAELGGFEGEITVYPPEALHTTPRCGITGRPMARASIGELRRILNAHPAPSETLLALASPLDPETMTRLIPELLACRGVLQNHYHHLDVFEHTWSVVRGLERMAAESFERFGRHAENLRNSVDPTLLFLSGICHDLGKPATQSFARDGRIRFLGHEQVSADLVRRIGPRIGLSPASTDALVGIVAGHLEAVRIPAEDGPPSRIYRMCARVGHHLPDLALLSLADVEAARGPAQSAARIEEHEQFVDFLLEQFYETGFVINPVLPVTDDDLTEHFGALNARDLARLRAALSDAFVDGDLDGREDALALASDLLADPAW